MKIVAISDTHGLHSSITNKIPPCDLLLHCGDVSSVGRVEQVGSFLYWFNSLPAKNKVFIAGNHDWLFETQKSLATKMASENNNITYLEDSGVIINGLKIYGTPWQPEFCNWAFNLRRGKELQEKWDLIPNNIDILLTHGAPFGILDRTVDGCDTGCVDLLNKLQKIKPKYHFFGHIHEAYGCKKLKKTIYYNCSTCDEHYRPVNEPVIIDI